MIEPVSLKFNTNNLKPVEVPHFAGNQKALNIEQDSFEKTQEETQNHQDK